MAKLLRVPVGELLSGELVLSKDAAHYLTRVHRVACGTSILLFDPESGLEAKATLTELGKTARCEVETPVAGTRLGLKRLRLFQGIGKGQKLEQVIRDATALGVGRISPVVCERGVVRLDIEQRRLQAKAERWRSVAIEAARQSERSDIPQIDVPATFLNCGGELLGGGEHIILDPNESENSLCSVLQNRQKSGDNVALWIGPEGGFTLKECEEILEKGGRAASLGPLVLRTEVAATAAVSIAAAILRGDST